MVTRVTIVKLSPLNILLLALSSVNAAVLNVPDTVSETNVGKVYTLHRVKQTWLDARRICRHGNGYLINLGSEEKYQMFVNNLKNGAFNGIMDKPWTGLYWSSPSARHWDGPGCPPQQVNLSSDYHWQNTNDYYFDNNYCYREDNGFQARECFDENTFICESSSATFQQVSSCRSQAIMILGCSYISSLITSFKIKFFLTPLMDNCKNYCDSLDGCFLTGLHGFHCIAMMARDVSNTSVALKQCPTEEVVETSEVLVITSADHGNPTECHNETTHSVAITSTASLSSSLCPTITATAVETVTVSETVLTTSMMMTSHVVHATFTVTENYTSTLTRTVYMSGSDVSHVFTVTETSCETPNGYFSASVPSCSQSSSSIFESSSIISFLNETTSSSQILMKYKANTVLESASHLSASFTSSPVILGSDGVLRSRVCRNVIVVTPDPVLTSQVVQSIVNELTVDKKNISAVIQKKISTTDERQSSTAIGYAGIVFLVAPLLLILVLDVPNCIVGGKKVVELLKSQRDASRLE